MHSEAGFAEIDLPVELMIVMKENVMQCCNIDLYFKHSY